MPSKKVMRAIEESPVFKRLNEGIAKVEKDSGKELTPEQYQAARKLIILKTMETDEKVIEAIAKDIYEEFNK